MQTLLNNRYQVIQTLGSGGFGNTYLAEDTQMPSQRRCVIKQLKPIQHNPEIYKLVQERFQREAAILEDLGGSTDQIPSLYAYFQSEGQFYVVQEWVEGDTLTTRIKQQGWLSEGAVRDILIHLLPVLEYIHNKRILHRDIKPDNIILRHRDGKPVLIDFGAVRESMGTVFNSQGNPTSSIVIGTPGYMPSEQAAGRPVYSSDLYSLGMTAIYLLTGRQPQELESDPRTGEIVWRQYALNVSPSLAMVIDQAIAYHPRDRFPTARDMLTALQPGVATFPPTVPYTPPPAVNVSPTVPVNQYSPPSAPQNTVAVSPPPAPQSATSTNVPRSILVGSLIAGGLVTTAVIIGFTINNQQSQLVTQPTPIASEPAENTVPVVTPEPTPIVLSPSPTPLATATPTFTPPTTPTPTPTPTGRPYLGVQMVTLTPEIRDRVNNQLGDRINLTTDNGVLLVSIVPNSPASVGGLRAGDVIRSINNQTMTTMEELEELISNSTIGRSLSITVERNGQLTPITVVPSQQPAPSETKQTDIPSPETAIQNYYANINRGDYRSAWNQISIQHQNNTVSHPNGFNSFLDWWQQVRDVEIQQLTSQRSSRETATVDSQVSYATKSGRKISQSVRFFLRWDASSQTWLIDKTEQI
jgi:serine/threonine protein kinase, bacterial